MLNIKAMPYSLRIIIGIATTLYLAHYHIEVNAAQAEPQKTNDDTKQDLPTTIGLNFTIAPQTLIRSNSANENFWLDIGDQKILVLKYWARGKVSRGNAIILHAQGEHPDHPRIMANLSKQLSELGWHVYIPSLPNPDYPINSDLLNEKTKAPNEVSPQTEQTSATPENQQETAQTHTVKDQKHNFFANDSDYQDFISQILDQLMLAIQPKLTNLVLVTNQNSSYWSLPTTQKSNSLTHVVLIEPQIPNNKENDLENRFSEQSLPVFTFVEDEQSFSHFVNAFERQLWRSPFLRINRGQFSNQGIEMEDVRIAKLISGWIQAQQKSN